MTEENEEIEENEEEIVEELEVEEEETTEEVEEQPEETIEDKIKKMSPEIRYAIQYIVGELKKEAEKNEYFKAKLEDKSKNEIDMWSFICNKAKRENSSVIHHSKMIRWACDYYNDPISQKDIERTDVNTKMMCENAEEDAAYREILTAEEIAKAKNKALEEVKQREMDKLLREQRKALNQAKSEENGAIKQEEPKKVAPKIKKEKEVKKKTYETMSLFDFND